MHLSNATTMKTSALWQPYNADHHDAVLAAVRSILDACRDGEHGYTQAANDVQDAGLKELFGIYASQRRGFAEAIEKLIPSLAAEPRRSESLGGRIHRRWLDIRATIDHGSAASMLAECERGENAARTRYEHALSLPMPSHLRETLLGHLTEIRLIHDQLDRMRGR